MRITSIGTAYRDGKEKLVDFEAEQMPEEGPSKTSLKVNSNRGTPLASPVIAAEKGAMPATLPTSGRLRRTRKYTTLEKSSLRLIASGMWVGATFWDHGRRMRITSIGKVYKDGTKKLIDVEAEEIPDERKSTLPAKAPRR